MLAASMAVLLPAVAHADVEPNGAVFMPEGPIAGGQDIKGTVGPGDTDDWYVLHVEGTHQLHLVGGQPPPGETPTFPHGGPIGQPLSVPRCVTVELTNADGTPIPSDFTSPEGSSTFHVHVALMPWCSTTMEYSFRVDPAQAVVSGPGRLPIKGTAEPNDRSADAGGPLLPGAWYHSELETANDQDWLRFYVRRGTHRIDVQAVAYGSPCGTHVVRLKSSRGAEPASYVGTNATIKHLRHRQRGPARLYVQVANHSPTSPNSASCVRSATVVQVAPEDAIMEAAEVRASCGKSRRAGRTSARRVAAGKRAIARARARGRATGALRRKLKRDQRSLKSARRGVAAYCS